MPGRGEVEGGDAWERRGRGGGYLSYEGELMDGAWIEHPSG